MRVRMTCKSVNATLQNDKPIATIRLEPVAPPNGAAPSPENAALWGKGAPGGALDLQRVATDEFKVGAEYLIEVTPAPKA